MYFIISNLYSLVIIFKFQSFSFWEWNCSMNKFVLQSKSSLCSYLTTASLLWSIVLFIVDLYLPQNYQGKVHTNAIFSFIFH